MATGLISLAAKSLAISNKRFWFSLKLKSIIELVSFSSLLELSLFLILDTELTMLRQSMPFKKIPDNVGCFELGCVFPRQDFRKGRSTARPVVTMPVDSIEDDFFLRTRTAGGCSPGSILIIYDLRDCFTIKHGYPLLDYLLGCRLFAVGLQSNSDFTSLERIQRIGGSGNVQKGNKTLRFFPLQPIGAGHRGGSSNGRGNLAGQSERHGGPGGESGDIDPVFIHLKTFPQVGEHGGNEGHIGHLPVNCSDAVSVGTIIPGLGS